MDSVLVVEDVSSLREVLCAVLNSEGYRAVGADSGESALDMLRHDSFSLILSDLKLPGIDGLKFLEESKPLSQRAPIVVMTAYGTINTAVQAMKLGATDFITKPFDPSALCQMVHQIVEHKRIIDRTLGTPSRSRTRKFITDTPSVMELLRQAQKVAPLSTPVLILGESGTGKDMLARHIHEQSTRADKPFVAVNCGSMPDELMESEFFGHEAGSFTGATEERAGLFEVADTGTIFLDEIGNMPLALQMKLLRTLQESEIRRLGSTKTRKIDSRVISATNCKLESRVRDGSFREDLFYRLGVVILEVPPLHARPADIPLLTNYFLKCLAHEMETEVRTLTPQALKKLESYPWPGNVRELENVIERAIIFSRGPITPELIELPKVDERVTQRPSLADVAHRATRAAEMAAVRAALADAHGNKSKAARLLGVSYKTLLNKLKDFDRIDRH